MMFMGSVIKRKIRARRDTSYFKALISSPVSGSVTLPASGRFAVRAKVAVPLGTLALTLVGPATKQLMVPQLAAGEFHIIDNIEKNTVVTVSAQFDLYIDTGENVLKLIVVG